MVLPHPKKVITIGSAVNLPRRLKLWKITRALEAYIRFGTAKMRMFPISKENNKNAYTPQKGIA